MDDFSYFSNSKFFLSFASRIRSLVIRSSLVHSFFFYLHTSGHTFTKQHQPKKQMCIIHSKVISLSVEFVNVTRQRSTYPIISINLFRFHSITIWRFLSESSDQPSLSISLINFWEGDKERERERERERLISGNTQQTKTNQNGSTVFPLVFEIQDDTFSINNAVVGGE